MRTVGIVGGGILGSWTAHALRARGFSVTLFERDGLDSPKAASFAAGGLLCPFSELESAEPLIARLGARSLSLWETFHQQSKDFYFRRQGTLVLVHASDRNELQRLRHRLDHLGFNDAATLIDKSTIRDLEPGLATGITTGLYFPDEGQLDPRTAHQSLQKAFVKAGGKVVFRDVTEMEPGRLFAEESQEFDWVIDCRGLAAKKDLPHLRGVRGERLTLRTPEIVLNRSVRLLHPTIPLYLAPLENARFVVGATMLESETEQKITVRSMVELLSAAFSIDTRFAEAEVVESVVGHRPAFPDNLPAVEIQNGLIRMNGLFRHGYLISPALAEEVAQYLCDQNTSSFSEGALCKFA